VLLSDFPEHVRGRGLSLEMLVEWDQVRSVLEAGTVDEATLEEVFGKCSISTPLGPRVTKAGFGLVHNLHAINKRLGISLHARGF